MALCKPLFLFFSLPLWIFAILIDFTLLLLVVPWICDVFCLSVPLFCPLIATDQCSICAFFCWWNLVFHVIGFMWMPSNLSFLVQLSDDCWCGALVLVSSPIHPHKITALAPGNFTSHQVANLKLCYIFLYIHCLFLIFLCWCFQRCEIQVKKWRKREPWSPLLCMFLGVGNITFWRVPGDKEKVCLRCYPVQAYQAPHVLRPQDWKVRR